MIYICPYCQLDVDPQLLCHKCERRWTYTDNGQPDFTIPTDFQRLIAVRYTPKFGEHPWSITDMKWPVVNFYNFKDSNTWERSMLNAVPVAVENARSLDMGCGEHYQRFKKGLEQLGYIHTGIDIGGTAPDVIGDAHALPFQDKTFDVIISSAVFEHLKNPFLAMQEIYRVAKKGATIIMSIAYNEPFHISYFHHSQMAAFELMRSFGVRTTHVVLHAGWNSFNANLDMGYAGARMPGILKRLITGFIKNYALLPARIKNIWTPGHYQKALLSFARSHSGSVGIVAVK